MTFLKALKKLSTFIKWQRIMMIQMHNSIFGQCMPKFKGAIKGMSKKIIELNKKAAEQSNAKAGFNHDIIYFKGESVEKDQREAILQHLKINILNN